MQRSQLGMLCSPLHELLLTDKAFVPVAFPLWTEKDGAEEPDFHEVAAAFRRTLAADKRKICFFIDGLDEYEDDSISHCGACRLSWGACKFAYGRKACGFEPTSA